jgi:hypothetical protein
LLGSEDQAWIGMEAREFHLMDNQGLLCQASAFMPTISAPVTTRGIDEVNMRGVSSIDGRGSRCLSVIFAPCVMCLLPLCFVGRMSVCEGGMTLVGGHEMLR